MYLAILGRQPAISTAELEAAFGSPAVERLHSDILLVKTDNFDISRLGGTKKAGLVFAETAKDTEVIQKAISKHIVGLGIEGKITLGISAYHSPFQPKALLGIGLKVKNALRRQNNSVRLIPSDTTELSTAASHHNKLGLSPNKIEILIVSRGNKIILASSTGAQNITAYAARDQKRPKRDAFVGMLPPKLAQIIINLAVGSTASDPKITILDPFCGTGVILQESLIMGFDAYGTDLNPKMIDYSRENLDWLVRTKNSDEPRYVGKITLEVGDATKHKWQGQINAVASEIYLGQPFSAIPSDAKLAEVRRNCRRILADFLENLAPQIAPNTPLCLAIPAWRTKYGWQHLEMLDIARNLGYNIQEFKNAPQKDLLYYRENQIVGRELLVLRRS
jgi:tRNA G10  N-methylase Trm11